MMRKLLVVSLIALAALPAALAGTSSAQVSASRQCAAVQAKLGSFSFAQVFPSFGACVTAFTPLTRQEAAGAVGSCRSERANVSFAATHHGKTFARFYGTGHKGKNAYARCVAAKERSASLAALVASSACQTQQTDAGFAASHGGQTFAQFYGTNAFAACVALQAHPSFTVSPIQPTPAASPQQSPKEGTVIGGCGPPETGGPPHPLTAVCLVISRA